MKVLQPTKCVVVKLSQEEANVLCALVGGIVSSGDSRTKKVVQDFFEWRIAFRIQSEPKAMRLVTQDERQRLRYADETPICH